MGGGPRWGRKRDAAEKSIVVALEAVGAKVVKIRLEKDIPDLLVGYHGKNYLLEVKSGTRKRKDQPGQETWASRWRGQTDTVRTVEQALTVIGVVIK